MNTPADDPARNQFFRFSFKRSLGSGLVSIAFRRSEPSGRMDTEFGGQVIAFERDNSSTIGAGLTTQLSKLRKRHILKFFPASWGHTLSPKLSVLSKCWKSKMVVWNIQEDRTPDLRSLPLVKRNYKSKSIIWSNKKSTWALEAAAGEAKGIGRPGTKSLDQKKVLF